jgi:hypothetical protein
MRVPTSTGSSSYRTLFSLGDPLVGALPIGRIIFPYWRVAINPIGTWIILFFTHRGGGGVCFPTTIIWTATDSECRDRSQHQATIRRTHQLLHTRYYRTASVIRPPFNWMCCRTLGSLAASSVAAVSRLGEFLENRTFSCHSFDHYPTRN